EGRRRRPARLAPPLRLALRAFPPPLRGGQCSCGHFHGLRSPSGFAPPVATVQRPSGASKFVRRLRSAALGRLTRTARAAPEARRNVATGEASAASATRGRLRQLRTAPEGRRRRPTRLAPPLRLALRAFPPPLRGGQCSCGHFHGLRSPSGFAPPVATVQRPSGASKFVR